jgi:hypothetical protein
MRITIHGLLSCACKRLLESALSAAAVCAQEIGQMDCNTRITIHGLLAYIYIISTGLLDRLTPDIARWRLGAEYWTALLHCALR